MAVFLARMVMPRSRSSSLESITRSTMASLARKVPLCLSMASTSVVLPWSTWAMMAMLLIPELKVPGSFRKCANASLPLYYAGTDWGSYSARDSDGLWLCGLAGKPCFQFVHRALGGANASTGGRYRSFAVGVCKENTVERLADERLHLRKDAGSGLIERMPAAVKVHFKGIKV